MATSDLASTQQTEYQKNRILTATEVTERVNAALAKLTKESRDVLVRLASALPGGPLPTVQTLPAEGVFLKINTSKEECKKIDDE